MNPSTGGAGGGMFYHGSREELRPGDPIEPGAADSTARGGLGDCVRLTPVLDEAIWDAELADGDGAPRVYVVEPLGRTGAVSEVPGWESPGHPTMSCYSREPLRVVREVRQWTYYHGTRADLKPGDWIRPGLVPNFGHRDRSTTYVYLTRTLDAATWGAELAAGDGPGRIYIVEPTGPVEEDPNLTNRKFRGNPTKSFRSREPLWVTGELASWTGHAPEAIRAMKEGLERLQRLGVEPEDD